MSKLQKTAIEELLGYFFSGSNPQDEILNLIKSSINVNYFLYASDTPIGKWPGAEPIIFDPDVPLYAPLGAFVPHQRHKDVQDNTWTVMPLDLTEDFPWKIMDFFDMFRAAYFSDYDEPYARYQFVYLLDDKGEIVINFNDYWVWQKMENKRAERCINMSPEGYDEELPF